MMTLRMVAIIVGSGFVLYAFLGALAFFGQKALMYPAPGNPIEPSAEGATLQRISGADGATVYALYAPAPPGAPTLVHFHGNGEDVAGQVSLVHAMRKAGLGVCAVEYPGYGPAKGTPVSEAAIYSASEAALNHLYELGAPRNSIVLQGQSLGTGVAAEMARRGHGARLVLISPYTSMVEMAARVVPFLPVKWLVHDRYETDRKAPALTIPVLVIHGTNDEVVPFAMGQRIAALLPNREFVPVEGGHHNDLFDYERGLVSKIAQFARGASVATH